MPWNKLNPVHEAHLRESIARGRIVLFTGAGFSLGAYDLSGQSLPTTNELTSALWRILFDGEPDDSSLGDVFSVGVRSRPRDVQRLLEKRLQVDPEALPEVYRLWYSMPWARIYTLNVDNLDEAVSIAFNLPRTLMSISALLPNHPNSSDLESIHLNGRLIDFPNITFAEEQYGSRTAHSDIWYQNLIHDLVARPVLFVGSTLQEPTLWHYVALLGDKGTRTRQYRPREYRPRSYIVTEHLSSARIAKLEQFNVVWIKSNHEQFANRFLRNCKAEQTAGLELLANRPRTVLSGFQEVSRLREKRVERLALYLMGREPTWADITEGYAIHREFEERLYQDSCSPKVRTVTITGTAGSGKSTTLMRLALRYDADGKTALWLNRQSEVPIHQLRTQAEARQPDAIFIDDIDRFGSGAVNLVRRLIRVLPNCIIVTAIRSSRYDQHFADHDIGHANSMSVTVPHLTNNDIELLIDALTRARRLGVLAGLSHQDRVRAFRHQARRQLLVALYQATTGRRFEEIIASECEDLPPELIAPYMVCSIATAFGYSLTTNEILAAIDDHSNEGLNRIARLVDKELLVRDDDEHLWIRHRRIAELAVEHYKHEGQLGPQIAGLLFALASHSTPHMPRHSRVRKLRVSLLQHDTLVRLLAGTEQQIRYAYEIVEPLLDSDAHYWLQRGRFEAEMGDPRLGKTFVDQARSLNPDDLFIRTGWADATIRYAADDANSQVSRELFNESLEELRDAIRSHGDTSPYPFDVLGRRVLAWVERASLTDRERNGLLLEAELVVEKGLRYHPHYAYLNELHSGIQRARLMGVVDS